MEVRLFLVEIEFDGFKRISMFYLENIRREEGRAGGFLERLVLRKRGRREGSRGFFTVVIEYLCGFMRR